MTNTTKLQSKPRSWEARQALITAIQNRQDFTTHGSLSGVRNDGWATSGRLEGEDLARFNFDNSGPGGIDYLVKSYATPIAWHTVSGEWHVVEQSFSVTTGAQQGIVRQALA